MLTSGLHFSYSQTPPPNAYNTPPPQQQYGGYGPPNGGYGQPPMGAPPPNYNGPQGTYSGRQMLELLLISWRRSRSTSAAAHTYTGLRQWRTKWLHLPNVELHWSAKSVTYRHQLLRTARTASRVHQRCEEYVHVLERALWLQERGHGDLDR